MGKKNTSEYSPTITEINNILFEKFKSLFRRTILNDSLYRKIFLPIGGFHYISYR